MSPRGWRLRIQDILDGFQDLKSFVEGMTPDQFQTDKKTYFAVIRSLEVIGEAAHHVPDEIKQKYPQIPWRKLKDFRNVLIHEYFGVDNEIVWRTLHVDLFPLKIAFEKILDSEKPE